MANYLSIKLPVEEEELLTEARKKYSKEYPEDKNYDYKVIVEALKRYVKK